ncbi:MAG TPA: hypothetical protein VGI74_05460 [Streptosporangiaceae bacterium]
MGRPLSTLWTAGATVAAGHPVGGHITRAVEDIGFFTGLGVAIVFFAAMALGRFTVIGAREAAHATSRQVEQEKAATADEPVPAPAGRRARPAATAPATPASATGRRSLTARLPRLPRRQPGGTLDDRPAGMTAATAAREPAGKRSDTPS